MGPGVLGQLVDTAPDATEEHQACLRCHAPLAEQAQSLSKAITEKRAAGAPALAHEQGLTCAACHVRQHQRFGPPRRDGSAPQAGGAGLPHRGWTASVAFGDSRFCAACHQFAEGDLALNGKFLENTYQEWKASRYSREGISCQSCHMPQRRHLWRGVHDAEMMKSAVTVRAAAPLRAGGMLEASLAIQNTGTGHRFPTYVTPKVIAEIYQARSDGKMLPGTLRQHVIARLVEMDLSREISDTRLAPDEEAVLDYRVPFAPGAAQLVYRLRVEPDAFYAEFFRSLLASGEPVRGKAMIHAARVNAQRSAFTFFEERHPLRAAGAAEFVPPQVVDVPAGNFVQGSDPAEREFAYRLDERAYARRVTAEQRWYDNELPRAAAMTGAYAITRTPITNRQYAAFVAQAGHRAPTVSQREWQSYGLIHPYERTRPFAWRNGSAPPGREDHPVVLVNQKDARAYATWLSRKTGARWRLPTEAEWEKAARGPDGRYFPWGNDFDAARLNSHDAGPFDTVAAGSYPSGASPYGALDAAGQVYEWTSSDLGPGRAIVKGGSWDDRGCGVCRPAARHGRPVELKHILIGFRLVREPQPAPILISVTGGAFVSGDAQGEPDEAPREVTVNPFRIMQFEVTNGEFRSFVAHTGHRTDPERSGSGYVWTDRWRPVRGASWKRPRGANSAPRALDRHPVVQVSARDAAAYCAWRGLRLPTEQEWEFAARGTDGRRYPWGNQAPGEGGLRRANYGSDRCCAPDASDGHLRTAPVGSYPQGRSPFGIDDLAGNVWEWTSSSYGNSGGEVALRGGGWGNDAYGLRSSYRHGNPPDIGLDMVGFRCAGDV